MIRRRSLLALGLRPALALALASGGGGGDEVGSGDNLAEQQILFVHAQLEPYLDACLALPSCGLSAGERELLRRVRDALPAERQVGGTPRFVSGRERPGFFVIDGARKTARTGARVGDPIYVDRDQLRFDQMDAPLAVALLVHELGHHHGARDEADLDILGAKVRAIAVGKDTRVDAMFNPELGLDLYFNDSDAARLILRDPRSLRDVTPELLRHYCGESSPAVRLRVGNAHWSTGADFVSSEGVSWQLRYTVSFSARYACAPGAPMRFEQTQMSFVVQESAKPGDAQSVRPGSIEFH